MRGCEDILDFIVKLLLTFGSEHDYDRCGDPAVIAHKNGKSDVTRCRYPYRHARGRYGCKDVLAKVFPVLCIAIDST